MNIKHITNEYGRVIPYYESDCTDVLWALRDSDGIVGIVQCEYFEEAYEICEDEIFPEAPSLEEILSDFPGMSLSDVDADPCFQEAYGYRPNGPNATDVHKHGIYEKDLNGNRLDRVNVQIVLTVGNHRQQTLSVTLRDMEAQ